MKRASTVIVAAVTVLSLVSTLRAQAPPKDLAEQIVKFTGARTKFVWVHQVAGKGRGWDAMKPEYELKGLDTAEGKARVILPGPAAYHNPCLSPDGEKVFYSRDGAIHVAHWDGSGEKVFAKGYALCSWRNPKDGTQWLYFTAGGYAKGPLTRARIDDPGIREVMWDDPSAETSHTLTVSADGTRVGGEFPWPLAGVAIVPKVSWKQYGNGCNASIAPDNSYRLFHMGEQAGHSGVMMYDDGGLNKRVVRFSGSGLPGRGKGEQCWAPRWTTDVRFFVTTSPMGGRAAELYLGRFDEEFKKVVQWVRVTYEDGQDAKAACWIDPGLGQYDGEAPFTIEIPASFMPAGLPDGQAGRWRWDYGDQARAVPGKHTYTKPGTYTITARKGEKVIKGWANVRPRKAPMVTRARLLDETRLQVSFDERVRLTNATAALKSGTPIRKLSLDDEGLSLLIELGGKLPPTDALNLRGVTDRAQSPNAVQGAVRIARTSWPTSRAGLTMLWQAGDGDRFHYLASSGEFADTRLKPWKVARLGRNGAVELRGGVYFPIDAGSGIAARCKKTNQFSIEATVTPDSIHQGHAGDPRRIVSTQWGGGIPGVNFALAQERRKLVLYLYTRPSGKNARPGVQRVELCELTARVANHVVVSYEPGKLAWYLNGKLAGRSDKVTGTLPWRKVGFDSGMSMGGAAQARYPWRGKIEGLAIFARALDAGQAAADFAAYHKILAARKTVPRITLRARLVAKSRVPDPSEIAPYIDALVINEYEVLEVLRGKYEPKKIRVAQWGLLNKKPAPLSHTPIGATMDLRVERFDDHPQLEAEAVRTSLKDNFDLERYVDVTIRPAGLPRPAEIAVRPGEVWLPPGKTVRFSATAMDQYGNPIAAKIKWTVASGGQIDVGTAYGAGHWFVEARKRGTASIDQTGLLTADGKVGTVTVTASAGTSPVAKAAAPVGIGPYPGVYPGKHLPLRIGLDNGDGKPFRGDIDRVRIYRRVLTPKEIADHAAGKGLDAPDAGLVADWTFDERKGGAYANLAGEGLAAKVVEGEVQHVSDKDGKYVRLVGKGHIEVARDKRLDISTALSLEAWIRPRSDGALIVRQPVWMWGFYFGVHGGGLMIDGLRSHFLSLEAGYKFPRDKWTHVVGILGPGGLWQLYADGKLLKGYKSRPMIMRETTQNPTY